MSGLLALANRARRAASVAPQFARIVSTSSSHGAAAAAAAATPEAAAKPTNMQTFSIYRWSPEEGVEATLRCEEIKLTNAARRHRLVRRIVMSRTDSQRQDIAFQTQMAEATFYKDPETMNVQVFTADPEVAPHVRQYVDELTERYERRATHLDSDKIRGILRRYVEGMNSVMVRRGVYFVHESRRSTLDQLQDLVQRCSRGSSLHMIPLPDVPEQREMVKEAFNTEIVESATSLLDSVTGLIRKGRGHVAKKDTDKAKEAFQDIRSRISEYRNALGESQDRAEAALELVEDQLIDLTDLTEEEDE